jgi:hypothetical protein
MQLPLNLRSARVPGDPLRFDSAYAINWRRVDRRARRVMGDIVSQTESGGLRDGFALRRYADDAALLEALRAQLAGKRIKQQHRHEGRMPVKAAVLFAISPEGRKLHALVDAMEAKVQAQEAVTLCG